LPPLLSCFYFSVAFLEERYFLFKENSIKYLEDNSYSIDLTNDWVSINQLPEGAINILVEIEDMRFYKHNGYSLYDIHSAIFQKLILGRKLRGASTLTQQLARTLFLNRDKTIKRKLQEIRLAVALEKSLTKKEIIEYYLNTVYWGKGFNGIYYASRYHYRKPPETLTPNEFRELVQKLKRPDR
jgi:monofunctional biosynthetic peptidoglycan transglycosylase